MSAVWFVIMLVLIFAVVAMLTSPWRRPGAEHAPADDGLRAVTAEVEELQAAREAKYREIRDAELDRQTGKLSEDDFIAVDGGLRAEAVQILRRLDRAQARLDKYRAAEAETEVTSGLELEDADSSYHEAPS